MFVQYAFECFRFRDVQAVPLLTLLCGSTEDIMKDTVLRFSLFRRIPYDA